MRLAGELRPPGSKSIAQRALVCAAIARGETLLEGLPDGADVRAALGFAAACATSLEPRSPGGAAVTGSDLPLRPLAVDCGESGTLARFALAVLVLGCAPGALVELRARGTLRRRGHPALLEALERAGARIESRQPLRVRAAGPVEALALRAPASSQEVSGPMIALAALGGPRTLDVRDAIPSRPYVDLTRRVLGAFGADVSEREGGFLVRGPLRAPQAPLGIEPDASLAAVALAAGCLSGGEVTIPGLGAGSPQGDARIVDHLAAFGCAADAGADHLRAGGRPTRGAAIDLSGEPDLAPVLAPVAAAAALAGATSRLDGLATLQGKESPRIETLARGLGALGFAVEAGPEHLEVGPPAGRLRPARLDPGGDHRMAFAFALLGLFAEGVEVLDPGCVAKSWPGFWGDLGALAREP